MQNKSSTHDSSGQNIMATILQALPADSGLTKIEYEGPRIALYTTNPGYILRNTQIVSNMVNALKKRIVIRTDESIRRSEAESLSILQRTIPIEAGIKEIFFDRAIGEVLLVADKPSVLSGQADDYGNIDLVERIGWKIKLMKNPTTINAIRAINTVLANSINERIRFYKEVGEKIFRAKLSEIAEVSIIALGGFNEVGRSCILLTTQESRILLDCGINLTSQNVIDSVPRFDITGLKLNDIDAVVLSHAHLGHSGFAPVLFKYGYTGPVYCSEPTLPLMVLLQNNYMRSSAGGSFYSDRDLANLITHTIPLNFGIVTDISPDIKITLGSSGHMIGSALIHIHIGNGDHNLVYTGDLKFGRTYSVENAIWNFPRAETLIIEGTYGAKDDVFPQREEVDMNLINSINDTLSENGKILFPVPAVGLAQELILTINSYMNSGKIKQTRILLEKIISEATSIYEANSQYLSRELRSKLLETDTNPLRPETSETVDYARLDGEASIVLSPSSMLVCGPSVEYLKQISSEPCNKVILTSYQRVGTPGKSIEEGARKIMVASEIIDLRCKVDKVDGLDSHSDYNQLLAYVSRLRQKLRRVIINHGERAKAQTLAGSVNKFFKIQTQNPVVLEALKLM